MKFSLLRMISVLTLLSVGFAVATQLAAWSVMLIAGIFLILGLPFVAAAHRRGFVYGGLAGILFSLLTLSVFLHIFHQDVSQNRYQPAWSERSSHAVPLAITFGMTISSSLGILCFSDRLKEKPPSAI